MAAIRYVGGGGDVIKVSISMNKGVSWQNKDLLPGQSFPIPPNATNLLLNNVPYDAGANYKIRKGKIYQK